MRFKVDENLPAELAHFLRAHGHDPATVAEQGLSGAEDLKLAPICRDEGRALITLDLGFADLRLYPPGEYEGIVVLRPGRQSKQRVLALATRFTPLLDREPLRGRLWIVDEQEVRIRGGDEQS